MFKIARPVLMGSELFKMSDETGKYEFNSSADFYSFVPCDGEYNTREEAVAAANKIRIEKMTSEVKTFIDKFEKFMEDIQAGLYATIEIYTDDMYELEGKQGGIYDFEIFKDEDRTEEYHDESDFIIYNTKDEDEVVNFKLYQF